MKVPLTDQGHQLNPDKAEYNRTTLPNRPVINCGGDEIFDHQVKNGNPDPGIEY